MIHTKGKWVVVFVAALLAIGFLAAVLSPLNQEIGVGGPKEEARLDERFPPSCPPQGAWDSARGYIFDPVQNFPQEFLDSFERLSLTDNTEVLRLETRGFCVFQINGLVFVVFHDYEDSSGQQILGREELREWLREKDTGVDMCEIIWSQCSQKPHEVPQEPVDEDIESEALVLRDTQAPSLVFY